MNNPSYWQYDMTRLSQQDSVKYKIAPILSLYNAYIDLRYNATTPAGFFVRDINGNIPRDNANNEVYLVSPAAPDSIFFNMGKTNGRIIAELKRRGAAVTIVLDGGEAGITTLAFYGDYIANDPAILADKGSMSWWEYVSRRYANQLKQQRLGIEAALAEAGFPASIPYTVYGDGYGIERGRYGGYKSDCFDFTITKDIAGNTYPSPQAYLYSPNSGYNGIHPGSQKPWDMLTQTLNTVSGQILQNDPLSLPYVSAGWFEKYYGEKADMIAYMGFLKCQLTAGAVSLIQGYFDLDMPTMYNDAAVGVTSPEWVDQLITASHAQAMFTYLEDFLYNGKLLNGKEKHAYREATPLIPAMEYFPDNEYSTILNWNNYNVNTHNYADTMIVPRARVLARKLNGINKWLITAWANEGVDRDISVTVDTLGSLSLNARRAGSVYLLCRDNGVNNITLLDPEAMHPSLNMESILAAAEASCGDQVILPVNQPVLAAIKKRDHILVSWKDPAPELHSGYELQAGCDGETFGTISKMAPAAGQRNYQYSDREDCSNRRYYRLKITDFQQKSVYSNRVSVNTGKQAAFLVYPNPAAVNNTLYVSLPAAGQLHMFDVDGKARLNKRFPAGNHSISTEGFAKGAYYIYFTGEDEQTHHATIILQ